MAGVPAGSCDDCQAQGQHKQETSTRGDPPDEALPFDDVGLERVIVLRQPNDSQHARLVLTTNRHEDLDDSRGAIWCARAWEEGAVGHLCPDFSRKGLPDFGTHGLAVVPSLILGPDDLAIGVPHSDPRHPRKAHSKPGQLLLPAPVGPSALLRVQDTGERDPW